MHMYFDSMGCLCASLKQEAGACPAGASGHGQAARDAAAPALLSQSTPPPSAQFAPDLKEALQQPDQALSQQPAEGQQADQEQQQQPYHEADWDAYWQYYGTLCNKDACFLSHLLHYNCRALCRYRHWSVNIVSALQAILFRPHPLYPRPHPSCAPATLISCSRC